MDVEGKPRSDRALIGQMLASISTLNAHRRGAITRDGFFFGTGTIGKFPERHYAHTGGTLSRTSSPRSRAVVGERYGCRDVLLSASLRAARSEVVGTCKISSRPHKSGSREAMQQLRGQAVSLILAVSFLMGLEGASYLSASKDWRNTSLLTVRHCALLAVYPGQV
jgi:hypothetical protein